MFQVGVEHLTWSTKNQDVSPKHWNNKQKSSTGPAWASRHPSTDQTSEPLRRATKWALWYWDSTQPIWVWKGKGNLPSAPCTMGAGEIPCCPFVVPTKVSQRFNVGRTRRCFSLCHQEYVTPTLVPAASTDTHTVTLWLLFAILTLQSR